MISYFFASTVYFHYGTRLIICLLFYLFNTYNKNTIIIKIQWWDTNDGSESSWMTDEFAINSLQFSYSMLLFQLVQWRLTVTDFWIIFILSINKDSKLYGWHITLNSCNVNYYNFALDAKWFIYQTNLSVVAFSSYIVLEKLLVTYEMSNSSVVELLLT